MGALLWVLIGIIYVAGKAMYESGNRYNNRIKVEEVQAYVRDWADEELQKKLKAEIANPANYDAIWTRIEEYKRDGGAFSIPSGGVWDKNWDDVGKRRLALFNEKGKIPRGTIMEYNHSVVLVMLMNTYNKQTANAARGRIEKQLG